MLFHLDFLKFLVRLCPDSKHPHGGRGEAWRRERYKLFNIMSKYGRITMFPRTEVE